MPLYEPALTPRRREIAILMAEGRSIDEMARILTVTPRAVADDVDYLVRRLDPASQAKVEAWAAKRAGEATTSALRLWTVRPEPRPS